MKSSIWQGIYQLNRIVTLGTIVFVLSLHPWAIPFLFAFYLPSFFIYILSCAWTMTLLGGSVVYIKLGRTVHTLSGKPLIFRALGYKWNIHQFPLTGGVYGHFLESERYRTRRALIAISSSVASLLLCILSIFWLFIIYDFDLGMSKTYLIDPIIGFALANFYLFMITGIPGYVVAKNGKQDSTNGYLAITAFYMTDEQIQAKFDALPWSPGVLRELGVDQRLDLDELIARQKKSIDNFALLVIITNSLLDKTDSRFNQYMDASMSHPSFEARDIAKLLDLALVRYLMLDTILQNPKSDFYSYKFFEFSKDHDYARAIRGAVLVDLGRVEEGKALLNAVLTETKSDVYRELSLIFLSVAEEKAGDLDGADRYAREVLVVTPLKTKLRNRLSEATRARLGIPAAT